MIPGKPPAKPDRDGRQRQAEQQTEQNIHRIVHAQIDPAVRQQGRPYENGYGIPPPAEQHGSEQRDREADGRMGGNRAVQPAPVVPDRMHQRFDAGRMGRTQLRHVMLEEVAYLVVRYDRRTQKQHDPQQTARSEPPPHGIQQHGIQRNPSEPGRHEIEESVPESASVAVQGEQELPVEIEKRLPHSGVFRSVSKIRRKKRIANYPSAYGEGPVLRAVRAAGLTEEQSGSHGTPYAGPSGIGTRPGKTETLSSQ